MATVTRYRVEGMTCEHCVKAVTSELQSLDGVQDVNVALVPSGTSTVSVTSDAPLEADAVAGAVDEAGYALADG